MKTFVQIAAALVLTSAIGLATTSSSEAGGGRNSAAAVGFGAGAVVGASAAGSYNNGYYGEPGYAYDAGYADSYGQESYAYEAAPRYTGSVSGGHSRGHRQYLRNCQSSPASMNFGENCY